MAKKFKVPFAFTGDKTTVPVALQPDGSVSYTQGFGPDYELDKLVDPINAKDVPRDQTNQLFFDVTESLGEVQQYGAAIWSADMAPYPINARVAYDDKYWRSNIAANSDEPGVGAGWDDISTPQNIASFGIGTNTPPQIGNLDDPAKPGGLYIYSSALDTGTNPTGGALNGVVLIQPYSATLSRQVFREVVSGAGLTSSRLWERQINGATLGAWELITGSLLDSVRIDVASASTVNLTTAAPNTRHINITGTTAITGFTVSAGRCYFVRFAGALTLTNGAGLVTNRGANITTAAGDTCIIRATAENTVEILCGDFLSEASVGARGQTWQDVTGSRVSGTIYTNTTGRPISVIVSANQGPTPHSLSVGGIIVSSVINNGAGERAQLSAIIPHGATYNVNASTSVNSWVELR